MKKAIAVLCLCIVAAAAVGAAPGAVESSVPAARTMRAKTRSYNETVGGSGTLRYIDQSDITFAMPLVIERFYVEAGDTVSVGDRIAAVDKDATASLIESLGQVSQLAIAAANLSTAVSLIPSEITADTAGRVISTAGNGAAIESGYSIATIAKSDVLTVSAAVSELDIAKVSLGQKAVFTCAAYPDTVFTGKVAAIASCARSRYSGAVLETVVDILIAPDKRDERLKAGLSADVEIQLSEPRTICVLSYDAIAQDESGEYVYVYENGAAVRRNIFTGAEFSDGTEVVKGIDTDDIIFAKPEEISESRFIKLDKDAV